MQQNIKKLADNRMNLDFALRKAFSSYQFLKFFSNEESKVPDEVEVWFTANCSQSYKEFLEESTRRVIEEEFNIVLKRGAVVQSKTNSFPIVYFTTEVSEESKLSEEDTAALVVVQQAAEPKLKVKTKTRQQETRIFINGWIIYHMRKTNKWKVIQKDKGGRCGEITCDTRESAVLFAENNLTNAAVRRFQEENDRMGGAKSGVKGMPKGGDFHSRLDNMTRSYRVQANKASQEVRCAKEESPYVV